MTDRYLFRLDGSRENDEFCTRYSSSDCRATYSGTPLKIGPGWIPDFLEITVNDGRKHPAVVLIELEATRTAALESARKYLPEKFSSIIQAVIAYLKTIIAQCRGTADPRLAEIEKLLKIVSTAERIEVFTAAGLRDSANLVEILPLLHQPVTSLPRLEVHSFGVTEKFEAKGQCVLSPNEANALERAVVILHAVVTGRDDSGLAGYRSFLNKPLLRIVDQQPSATEELHRLLHKAPDRGLRIDVDRLIDELHFIWSRSSHVQPSRQQVSALVEEYFPIAQSTRSKTSMRAVFREARKILEKCAR